MNVLKLLCISHHWCIDDAVRNRFRTLSWHFGAGGKGTYGQILCHVHDRWVWTREACRGYGLLDIGDVGLRASVTRYLVVLLERSNLRSISYLSTERAALLDRGEF